MLVLLNGGYPAAARSPNTVAPLADACVTEWRLPLPQPRRKRRAPLLNKRGVIFAKAGLVQILPEG